MKLLKLMFFCIRKGNHLFVPKKNILSDYTNFSFRKKELLKKLAQGITPIGLGAILKLAILPNISLSESEK